MSRRLSLVPAALLVACLAGVPACKKKQPDGGGGEPEPGPAPPAAVSSDHAFFAHLHARSIRDSALFTEFKEAFVKAGGAAEWDKLEAEFSKDIGIKLTDIDSATVCVTEFPEDGGPKFVLIL